VAPGAGLLAGHRGSRLARIVAVSKGAWYCSPVRRARKDANDTFV
jgi:hypothetical protein